jgi:hypothetical protein
MDRPRVERFDNIEVGRALPAIERSSVMRQEHSVERIEYAPPLPPRRRSGVGIASFCVAVAAAVTLIVVFWAMQGRPASDIMPYWLLGRAFTLPMNMMACNLFGLAFIVAAVGAVLGAVSMFQRRRYRGLPIAGLAINVLLGLFVLRIWAPLLLRELTR